MGFQEIYILKVKDFKFLTRKKKFNYTFKIILKF